MTVVQSPLVTMLGAKVTVLILQIRSFSVILRHGQQCLNTRPAWFRREVWNQPKARGRGSARLAGDGILIQRYPIVNWIVLRVITFDFYKPCRGPCFSASAVAAKQEPRKLDRIIMSLLTWRELHLPEIVNIPQGEAKFSQPPGPALSAKGYGDSGGAMSF